jgi:hypothetical protein
VQTVTNADNAAIAAPFHVKQWSCRKCGGSRRSALTLKCLDCASSYSKANRPKYSQLTDEQRKRSNARSYTKVLILRGVLVPQPCACGAMKVTPHHRDYDNPRDIEWLCGDCHRGPSPAHVLASAPGSKERLMPRIRGELIERLEGEGFITVPVASALTKVGERTIRTWTRTGRIKIKRVGALVFVELASLCAAAGLPLAAQAPT